MKYAIFYVSKSGNTEAIAKNIKAALPEADLIAFGEPNLELAQQADVVFLGACARGNLFIKDMLDFMSELKNKKLALFLMSGYGNTPAFFDMMLDRIEAKVGEGCEVVGRIGFQGKIDDSKRIFFEKKLEQDPENNDYKSFLANFEIAKQRPNQNDFDRAQAFAKEVLEKMQ